MLINHLLLLEQEYGDKQKAWSYTMVIVGLIMAALTIYNYFSTPRTEDAKTKEEKSLEPKVSFELSLPVFSKKQIGFVLFILLFRLGESQLLKMLLSS
jgi:PAT family beta-lactamase induction signal transducer AmpG